MPADQVFRLFFAGEGKHLQAGPGSVQAQEARGAEQPGQQPVQPGQQPVQPGQLLQSGRSLRAASCGRIEEGGLPDVARKVTEQEAVQTSANDN